MKSILTLIISFFIFSTSTAQKFYSSYHPDYILNIDSADFYFEQNQFEIAKPFFEKALAVHDYSFLSKFKLAVCHFEVNDKTGNDWLAKAAYQNWEHFCKQEDNDYKTQLDKYSDLINWQNLNGICEKRHNDLDSNLMQILTEIDKFDQGIRRGDLTEEDYAASEYYDSEMGYLVDSVNLNRMMDIFQEHGYPGKDLVGPFLAYTGYLVLQHADLRPDIQEQFYPLLKTAVENHQVPKNTIAYLNDRIKVNRRECQDFGTQMGYDEEAGYFMQPVTDLKNLNKRRAEYHLPPIEDYLTNWGLTLTEDAECKD